MIHCQNNFRLRERPQVKLSACDGIDVVVISKASNSNKIQVSWEWSLTNIECAANLLPINVNCQISYAKACKVVTNDSFFFNYNYVNCGSTQTISYCTAVCWLQLWPNCKMSNYGNTQHKLLLFFRPAQKLKFGQCSKNGKLQYCGIKHRHQQTT